MVDYIQDNPKIVVNGFIKSGILQALDEAYGNENMEDTDEDLDDEDKDNSEIEDDENYEGDEEDYYTKTVAVKMKL